MWPRKIQLTWYIGCEWCIWGVPEFWKFIFAPIGGWYCICIGGLGCGGTGGCSWWWETPVVCIGCWKWLGTDDMGGWWTGGGCDPECIGSEGILGTWEDCVCDIWLAWVFRGPLGCSIACGGIGWEWIPCAVGVDMIGNEDWFCCCFLTGNCACDIFAWSGKVTCLGVEWATWTFVCWTGCEGCDEAWGWLLWTWIKVY